MFGGMRDSIGEQISKKKKTKKLKLEVEGERWYVL